ncbi:unnamed protein product [Closterium sp. NIES-53]
MRVYQQLLEEPLGAVWDQVQFSSSYHPETDGQTERTNQTMEQLIRATCNDPATWEQLLPLIDFAYNNATSAMTQHSPFYLNYGQNRTVPITSLQVLCELACDVGKIRLARDGGEQETSQLLLIEPMAFDGEGRGVGFMIRRRSAERGGEVDRGDGKFLRESFRVFGGREVNGGGGLGDIETYELRDVVVDRHLELLLDFFLKPTRCLFNPIKRFLEKADGTVAFFEGVRLFDEYDGVDRCVQECTANIDLSEQMLLDVCDADEDAHRCVSSDGREGKIVIHHCHYFCYHGCLPFLTVGSRHGLANGGGFLGGGVTNSDYEPKDAEASFVGFFVVKTVVVVEVGNFDDVVVAIMARADGVLRRVARW